MPKRPTLSPTPLARTGSFALLVAALALSAHFDLQAQKGKPPAIPDSRATLQLADRQGDGLVSDFAEPYPGAVIYGSSGDLRLELAPILRTIHVRFGAPIAVHRDAGAVPEDEVIHSDAVLYVKDIRSVARGTTATRVGRLGLGTRYPNHVVGFRYTTTSGVDVYGTQVCVTRKDVLGAIWEISASCPAEPSDTAGFFEEGLRGKVTQRFKATYAVPFLATVTCTANCPE